MRAVVIPAYQPDEKLIELVNDLWNEQIEVIVVDDGSGTEYQEIFNAIKEEATILHHEENKGKGAAIKTGLTYIGNELYHIQRIAIMDADGQHTMENLRRVFGMLEINRRALIIGSRDFDVRGVRIPWKSWWGNRLTRISFRIASGVLVRDTQSGLRAFSRAYIENMTEVSGDRYEYEMNVLFACARRHIPIVEVNTAMVYHDIENSCSHFDAYKDSMKIYKAILRNWRHRFVHV